MADTKYEIRCLHCGEWSREHPWFEGHPVKHGTRSKECFKAHSKAVCGRRFERVDPETREADRG